MTRRAFALRRFGAPSLWSPKRIRAAVVVSARDPPRRSTAHTRQRRIAGPVCRRGPAPTLPVVGGGPRVVAVARKVADVVVTSALCEYPAGRSKHRRERKPRPPHAYCVLLFRYSFRYFESRGRASKIHVVQIRSVRTEMAALPKGTGGSLLISEPGFRGRAQRVEMPRGSPQREIPPPLGSSEKGMYPFWKSRISSFDLC